MANIIVGYCLPKIDAEGMSVNPMIEFRRQACRALEINTETKSVLLISPDATAVGMFDLSEIEAYFECEEYRYLVIPKGLTMIQKAEYYEKVFSHWQNKQRDMDFIGQMVIAESLYKGRFSDYLYFNFSS